MCYAFRDMTNDTYPPSLDNIYDDNIILNKTNDKLTEKIKVVDEKLKNYQSKMDKMVEKYKSIIDKYSTYDMNSSLENIQTGFQIWDFYSTTINLYFPIFTISICV